MAKIVFWLGPSVEKWDPVTALETGIGGSETAAIHMSRELALLGHEVVVYANIDKVCSIDADDSGQFPHSVNVDWMPYSEMPARLPCDLFISSRSPDARQRLLPHCRRAWLWVHDLHCGPDWDNVIGTFYDKILCLSAWARTKFLEYYPRIDSAKAVQTRNTVDGDLFFGLVGANVVGYGKVATPVKPGDQHFLWATGQIPFRTTFSSSPDRGLSKLLDLWPKISKLVSVPRNPHPPELHVYYGFETWAKMAELQDRREDRVKITLLREKMDKTPGLVYHGRAGQAEIARSHLQSPLWLYPTDFLETSCCHPDSMISLPGDHRVAQPYRVRISDLTGKTNFPVYTYDRDRDRFRIGTALWCAQTKIASELVELELDDGSRLRVTPDHKVMNFDSEWVEAGNLEPGDRLLALHHRYNVSIKDVTGRWVSESRLVGQWMEEQRGRSLLDNHHVDHLDPMRLDNNPERLQVLARSYHFKKTHLGKVQRHYNSSDRTKAYRKWFDSNVVEVTKRLKKNGKKLWDYVNSMTVEERKAWCAERAYRKVVSMRLAKFFPDYKERVRYLAARHSGTGQIGRGFWDWLNGLPDNLKRSIIEDTKEGRWNHRIVSVKRISGGPVYDMEVEKYHTFVADGVVVHNCITAMEAQAAGSKVVATRCGALPETVTAGYLVEGPTSAPDYDERFLANVREALADDSCFVLDPMSWSSVAKQWDAWLKESV